MFEISWNVQRPSLEPERPSLEPEVSNAEREYMHRFQLNFWFNQCYNPHAHECQDLHIEVFDWRSWSELLIPQQPERFSVGHNRVPDPPRDGLGVTYLPSAFQVSSDAAHSKAMPIYPYPYWEP
jgi:hypothetical protein